MGTRSVLGALTGLLIAAAPVLAEPPAPESADSTWTLAVAAQTDSRGELTPCHCPGNPTGGLSRRSGLLSQFRALPEGLIAVDGGDFSPDLEDSLRLEATDLMIDAMALMGYGAVGVGERDLLQGRAALSRAAERLPLVAANLRLAPELPPVPAVRWILHRGRRVAVTGCLDPSLYYEHPESWADPGISLVDPWDTLDSVLVAVRDSADLVIVLAHAPLDAIEAWLTTSPPVDVVVAGHEPDAGDRRLDAPPFLLETGPRSRQVGLALLEKKGPALRLTRYRLVDLMETGASDSRIDRMVGAFQDAHGPR